MNVSISVGPVSGAVSVAAAAVTGLDVLGAVGGALATVATVASLLISVAVGNAKRRRQYDVDIKAAEKEGEDRYRPDMEFWRGIAVALLQTGGHAVPLPPSQRPQPRRE